jgi:DNA-binding transcriptional LysR family regulator
MRQRQFESLRRAHIKPVTAPASPPLITPQFVKSRARRRAVRMSGNLETNSPIAFRVACINGQGILVAPSPFVIDDLKSGAFLPILDEYLGQQFSIDALYPHREHSPAKVRTFIDLLAKNLHRIDFDPCAHETKRSNDKPHVTTASADSHPVAERRTSG